MNKKKQLQAILGANAVQMRVMSALMDTLVKMTDIDENELLDELINHAVGGMILHDVMFLVEGMLPEDSFQEEWA